MGVSLGMWFADTTNNVFYASPFETLRNKGQKGLPSINCYSPDLDFSV